MTELTVEISYNFSTNVAVAISSAAELDNPLPIGTSENITALNEEFTGISSKYWTNVP